MLCVKCFKLTLLDIHITYVCCMYNTYINLQTEYLTCIIMKYKQYNVIQIKAKVQIIMMFITNIVLFVEYELLLCARSYGRYIYMNRAVYAVTLIIPRVRCIRVRCKH